MKREILFRGKRIDNGEWVYGSLVLVCDGETLKRYPCIVISYNHDTFDWHEVDPKTVGQFTGLTDKNGVKIFEGDIPDHYAMSGYVMFENGMFSMSNNANTQFCNCKQPLAFHNVKDMEVIGNIHDNPELI